MRTGERLCQKRRSSAALQKALANTRDVGQVPARFWSAAALCRFGLFFRLEQREEDDVANRFRAGKQHRQSIHPETETARRRHTVFKREQKFFIDLLCFFASLLEETFPLNIGIIQLAVAGRYLHAVND